MLTNILTATVTAYCSCRICCGPNAKGITANGKTPTQGITIAASRSIKFGSLVIVKNHTYRVEDRLARKYDNRFDIYFKSHKEAKAWGKQTLKVIVIQ